MVAPKNLTTTFIGHNTPPETDPTTMDANAPAGSQKRIGAESIHGDRPPPDNSVVEVKHDAGSDIKLPLATDRPDK
jgi:hypothetical protein